MAFRNILSPPPSKCSFTHLLLLLLPLFLLLPCVECQQGKIAFAAPTSTIKKILQLCQTFPRKKFSVQIKTAQFLPMSPIPPVNFPRNDKLELIFPPTTTFPHLPVREREREKKRGAKRLQGGNVIPMMEERKRRGGGPVISGQVGGGIGRGGGGGGGGQTPPPSSLPLDSLGDENSGKT